MSADALISTYFATGTLPDLRRDPFIGGASVPPAKGAYMESFDPGTASAFGSFAAGTAEDVDQAVTSAVAGFAHWRDTPPATSSTRAPTASRLLVVPRSSNETKCDPPSSSLRMKADFI